MTKVKICGITNLEDALLSAKFGADALGFNFYEKSPRYIAPERARGIIENLPAEILKVGVFVNESLDKIAEIAESSKLDALQLHGDETPEFARELKARTDLEIIKAFRVSPEFKTEDVLRYETDAVLLDAYNPSLYGGTGETFDKRIAREVREIFPQMFLAGGLELENVAYSIDGVFPQYVDVCSGIEREKGKKDRVKTINFLKIPKLQDKEIQNIYDFCWASHPNLGGFRRSFEKLSRLKESLDAFSSGLFYAARRSDFDPEPFFSMFDKPRTDKASGFIDPSVPEHHLSFEEFVLSKFGRPRKYFGWDQLIIENTGNDDLAALYTFYALLEEYRIEYET